MLCRLWAAQHDLVNGGYMKRVFSIAFAFVFIAATPAPIEAPTGFDNLSNGLTDEVTHAADQAAFDEAETIPDGLGPVYNAQSCRECHQNPVSGAASQVSELRVGHLVRGKFQNPTVVINNGKDRIEGRSLINDRAICGEAQERVPAGNHIRSFRLSLNLLGDGFIEAIADRDLVAIARINGGKAIDVPILEAPGKTAIGRFGWKDQHASLLSFAADAYLNEMGVTSRLQPNEVTTVCQPPDVTNPNDKPDDEDGLEDIDRFARFMRSTKAPPRDAILAATLPARRGSQLFDIIGCASCHVRTHITVPAGTKILGGMLVVSDAIGGKVFHPFSDFLLHDVGTGDGIAIAAKEHHGPMARFMRQSEIDVSQNRMRTPPLWGVRMRTRLMHDGETVTFFDAIQRHGGEAMQTRRRFNRLDEDDQNALIAFLKSL